MTQNVNEAREVLRLLLVEPFRFTPVADGRRRGYAFTGTLALDRIVSGVIDLPTAVCPPVDSARVSVPRTNDENATIDWGKTLTGGSSPTGFEPVFWP